MSVPLIKFENVTFEKFGHIVFPDTCWEMYEGENWAVIGAVGSGKTTFLEAVEGRLVKRNGHVDYRITDKNGITAPNPQKLIASVYFDDRTINYGNFYYQQRYHAGETEGIATVRDFLGENIDHVLSESEALDIRRLLDTEIIKLSNGQFKKMLILKALLKKPRLLLLDNLYTGLDARATTYVSDMIEQIVDAGAHVIMTIDNREIPRVVNRVMEIDRFSVKSMLPRKDYIVPIVSSDDYPLVPPLPRAPEKTFDIAVQMDQVTIKYGGTNVVDNADWIIRCGEKWALTGANGAGKSMLLSLIFADNPQAYATKITLFDRKRGTGESIWDIKEKIGFVSPEMHVYFRQNKTCREVALSGLYENPYKRTNISDNIVRFSDDLFEYFSIVNLANNSFQRISAGQQNIVLLIRALVKNSPMLVLDEPFQGLDAYTVNAAKRLLNEYCRERTLIFVSHRIDEMPDCIDRCLHMEKGKALKKDRPE